MSNNDLQLPSAVNIKFNQLKRLRYINVTATGIEKIKNENKLKLIFQLDEIRLF